MPHFETVIMPSSWREDEQEKDDDGTRDKRVRDEKMRASEKLAKI